MAIADLLAFAARARVFDLEQPRFAGMPLHPSHLPGYIYHLYRRHEDTYRPERDGPRSSSSGMLTMMEHSGTHLDAPSHQADNLMLCGGVPVSPAIETPMGFTRRGVEEIAPIAARGVLFDVAAYRGVEEIPLHETISAAELQACAARQGVAIESGNVALVRLGNARNWNDEARYLASAGMARDASLWLVERGVIAVGADNMAWDAIGVWDAQAGCYLPGHLELLARRGITIMENLALDELSRERIYEFLFVCAPLKFKGATGSPVRPVALA
ncbi:MAG: cyclase family protein [Chloroflexi bacterium]|nr:cyclase family protein [Chloroflexota bacterium]